MSTCAASSTPQEPVSLAVVGLARRRLGRLRLPRARAPPTGSGRTTSSPTSSRDDGDPARRVDLELDRARAREAIARLVERLHAAGVADQRRPQHPADARRRPGRREPRQRPRRRPRAAGPPGRQSPTSSRSAPRTSPGSSPTGSTDPAPSTPPSSGGRLAARLSCCSPTAAHPLRVARPGRPVQHCRTPRGDRRRHRRRGRLPGRGPADAACSPRGVTDARRRSRPSTTTLLRTVLDDAVLVAALTCTRVGRRSAERVPSSPPPADLR